MKKVQIKILKTYNVIIAGVLALLGYTSSCNITDSRMEYGTPSAKFIVNGTIESGSLNTPIANIRVVMKGDTTVTDKDGKYQVIDKFEFPTDQTFSIEFQDIDGALNGDYQKLDTIVEFKDPQFTNGDGHWYKGETTKEFDVKLNPKK